MNIESGEKKKRLSKTKRKYSKTRSKYHKSVKHKGYYKTGGSSPATVPVRDSRIELRHRLRVMESPDDGSYTDVDVRNALEKSKETYTGVQVDDIVNSIVKDATIKNEIFFDRFYNWVNLIDDTDGSRVRNGECSKNTPGMFIRQEWRDGGYGDIVICTYCGIVTVEQYCIMPL